MVHLVPGNSIWGSSITRVFLPVLLLTLCLPLPLSSLSADPQSDSSEPDSEVPPGLLKQRPSDLFTAESTLIKEQADILNNWRPAKTKLSDFTHNPKYSKYFSLTRELSPRDVVGAVTFAYGTIYQSLDLEEMIRREPDIDLRIRQLNQSATDVLTGIQYGLSFTVLLYFRIDPDFDLLCDETCAFNTVNGQRTLAAVQETVEQHLLKQMEYLTLYPRSKVESRAAFDRYFKENPNAPKFKLDVFGDVTSLEVPSDNPQNPIFTAFNFSNSNSIEGDNESGKNENESEHQEVELEAGIRNLLKSDANNDTIKDVYQVLDYLDKVPAVVKDIDGGKGYKLSYTLTSFDKILKIHEETREKMERERREGYKHGGKREAGEDEKEPEKKPFEELQTIKI